VKELPKLVPSTSFV